MMIPMSRVYRLEKESLIDLYGEKERSFEQLMGDIQIKITKYTSKELEFDLIGIDCSFANALRRILIGEVPTMAVKRILLRENDSAFPDEFLAHRIGLIPLHADPKMFEFFDGEMSEKNSLKFSLDVRNDGNNILNIYSNDIKWIPVGNQRATFGNVEFEQDVLMFKLAPRQRISTELICTKNIGKEHAKWSPVCPATYRLMPQIEIDDIFDDEAYKLQSCFSKGVIDVRPCNGRMKAYVNDQRADSMSREALRHNEFDGKVFLGRRANHFLFTINSVFIDPLVLLKEALRILIEKCNVLRKDIESFSVE